MQMAIVHRRLRFADAAGEHTLIPSPVPQALPSRFENHPYYKAAVASGWIEPAVTTPAEEKKTFGKEGKLPPPPSPPQPEKVRKGG